MKGHEYEQELINDDLMIHAYSYSFNGPANKRERESTYEYVYVNLLQSISA